MDGLQVIYTYIPQDGMIQRLLITQAYIIAQIKSKLKNWWLLFIIKGGLTLFVALACFYILPDRPHNTRWLNPRVREVTK